MPSSFLSLKLPLSFFRQNVTKLLQKALKGDIIIGKTVKKQHICAWDKHGGALGESE